MPINALETDSSDSSTASDENSTPDNENESSTPDIDSTPSDDNNGEDSELDPPIEETVEFPVTVKDTEGNLITNDIAIELVDVAEDNTVTVIPDVEITSAKNGTFNIKTKKSEKYTLRIAHESSKYVEQIVKVEFENGEIKSPEITVYNKVNTVQFTPNDESKVSFYLFDEEKQEYDKTKNVNSTEVSYDKSFRFQVVPTDKYKIEQVTVNDQVVYPINSLNNEYEIDQITVDTNIVVNVNQRSMPSITAKLQIPSDVASTDDWAAKKEVKITDIKTYGTDSKIYYLFSENDSVTKDEVVEANQVLAEGTDTIEVTENGYLYLCVEDTYENGSSLYSDVFQVEVSQIDTEKPTGSVDYIALENGEIFLSMSDVDDPSSETMPASGIDGIYLSSSDGSTKIDLKKSGNSYIIDEDSLKDSNNVSLISDINSMLVCIQDKAGNIRRVGLSDIHVLKITYTTDYSAKLTLKAVIDNTTLSDDEYDIFIDGKNQNSIELNNNGSHNIVVKTSTELPDDESVILAEHRVTINNIDNVGPIFVNGDIATNWNTESWVSKENHSDDLSITLKARDDKSGVKSLRYAMIPLSDLDESGEVPEGYEYSHNTVSLLKPISESEFNISIPIDMEFNGIYRIWVLDKFGNESSYRDVTVKIDNTAPANLKLTYTESEKNPSLIKKVINALSFDLFFKKK